VSDEQKPAQYDPFLRGPFPAGVRTLAAHDEARGRVFPIEVWYPAALRHAGQDLAAETQDGFVLRQSGAQKKQAAVRDAEAHAGKFPLIGYSHHSGGHRRVATFLCTHLASHGYVVAAVDHSESIAPELARPADETEAQKNLRWQAVIESRVPDLEFLLDRMLTGADRMSQAKPDETRIGIVGHSFGAWTVLAAPDVDERIQAVVALAPGGTSNPRPGVLPVKLDFNWKRAVPAVYLVAENDVPLPLAGMLELFERAPEPRQMVILRRADHMHFLDDSEEQHEAFRAMNNPLLPPELAQMQKEMRPIAELASGDQAQLWVRGLTLAHMDSVLKQNRSAQEFLAGDIEGELAERGVEAILHQHAPRAIAG